MALSLKLALIVVEEGHGLVFRFIADTKCQSKNRNPEQASNSGFGSLLAAMMRRTKATLIYKRTKNLRAIQLLLGHSKLESTVRYLGIEVDDALEISEQTEI